MTDRPSDPLESQQAWEDRLSERALREALGGEQPPDLEQRILAAAAEGAEKMAERIDPKQVELPDRSAKSKLPRWAWALGTVAALLFVTALLALPTIQSARRAAPRDLVRSNLPQPHNAAGAGGQGRYGAPADPSLGDAVLQGKNQVTMPSSGGGGIGGGGPSSTSLGDGPREQRVGNTNSPSSQINDPQLASGASRTPAVRDLVTPAPDLIAEMASRRKKYAEPMNEAAKSVQQGIEVKDGQARMADVISRDRVLSQMSPDASMLPTQAGDDVVLGAHVQNQRVNRNYAFSPFRGQTEEAAPVGRMESRRSESGRFEGGRQSVLEGVNRPVIYSGRRYGYGCGQSHLGDQYAPTVENSFTTVEGEAAVSTFSIDVDTASYTNVRQFLTRGNQLPPVDAVRIEELINYFDYRYEGPEANSATPFAANIELASCPWQPKHWLARVALKGREMDRKERPVSNLVFLVDVSGSMNHPDKLPLVVEGLRQMTRELGENDRVAIVVYASAEGLALPSTPGTDQDAILDVLDRLNAGGSTAGGAGIELAYKIAQQNFVEGGVNRVILCTDGDFNVGVSDTAGLQRLAEQQASEANVFLTVLGFGRGNLNDNMMETISNKGNGTYHYIDSAREARKVLVEQMSENLVTIAKDVKIQIEFNPTNVAAYRLIGYANRIMAREEFDDDTKDAGEIGAGHTVTALYELRPARIDGGQQDASTPLKYQRQSQPTPPPTPESAQDDEHSDELFTLRLRYKQPDADKSTKLEFIARNDEAISDRGSDDFRFAAAVASFGMLLRQSPHAGNANWDIVQEWASGARSHDPHGYRAEFVDLVRIAASLNRR